MKKNQISSSKSGQKCCDKILKENWKVGCGPIFSQKRKAEEPLKEFSNWEEFQEFMQNPVTDKEDFVKTTETSTSGTKNEDEPSPYYLRRDDLNKKSVMNNLLPSVTIVL